MEYEDDFESVFKRALARQKLREMGWDFNIYAFENLASHEMSVQEYNYHVNKNKRKEEEEKKRGI